MLEALHLSKRYSSIPAVQALSFALRHGQVLGCLGPNGSGKSTTVKMLTGLLEPTRGVVQFDGRNIQDDLAAYRKCLGYVPEEALLYPYLSGWEYLEMIGTLRGMAPSELEVETGAAMHRTRTSRLGVLLHRWLLQTPFQKGCYGFVWKTLLRSEPHRLVLSGIGGLALVLACQSLLNAVEGANSLRAAALSPDALSIPFILTFLIIIGLRIVFEIPVELRANWIFQLSLDSDRQECESLARKVILALIVPCVLVVAFPAYAYFEGLPVACMHTILVLTWSVLLTNIVLIRFRKLPFTCTLPLFKQHSIVTILGCLFGFLIYALSTAEFEASALSQPARLIGLVPVAAVAWYIPHRLAKSTIDIERKLIFEESATRTIELLRLGDYGS